MAKLPIPDDWNGEDWECVQIKWPKSVMWRALLLGAIYDFGRGRSWNEKTGRVKDVQKIGKQIFNFNYPFVACATDNRIDCFRCGCEHSQSDCDGCGGDDCYNEVNLMGCCLGDIKIENGKLYKLRCGEWELVGVIGGQPIKDGENLADKPIKPTDPTDPVQTASFACAKATAYMTILYDVMQTVWEHRGDEPWNIIKNIQDDVGVDLYDNFVAGALAAIYEAAAIPPDGVDLTDIWTETPLAEAICRLAPKLDGTTSELTDKDVDHIVGVRDWLSNDFMEYSYIDQCVDCIGRDDFERAGFIACQNPDFVCECPEEPPVGPTVPIAHDWAHSFDFTQSDFDFTLVNGIGESNYEDGVGFVTRNWGNFKSLPSIRRTAGQSAEGHVRWLYMLLEWPNIGAADWGTAGKLINVPTTGAHVVIATSEDAVPVAQTIYIPYGFGQVIEYWIGQTGSQAGQGGQAIIKRIIVAGTGSDPYPDVEQYE